MPNPQTEYGNLVFSLIPQALYSVVYRPDTGLGILFYIQGINVIFVIEEFLTMGILLVPHSPMTYFWLLRFNKDYSFKSQTKHVYQKECHP